MLPDGFRFSQSSLQDFVDCPRRFQLRHLRGQVWPGVVAEPVGDVEVALERGARFHRMVERHQLGVDGKRLGESVVGDEELVLWWENYLGYEFLHGLAGDRYPELLLSGEIAGVRVVAALDLVVVQGGERVFLFDWKTYSYVPDRRRLAGRVQTRLYRWLLAACAGALFGRWVVPGRISLIYWLAGVPGGREIIFPYSASEFEEDVEYLEGVVRRVVDLLELGVGVWPLAADMSRCAFCEYRSLCGRGEVALEVSNDSNNMLEWEEVGFWDVLLGGF